ncbi:sugar kinase [Iocasia frigidifontis]|uniref:Sugar kinase n=1 Tax=Iocasia fonsfrigidae TaxID=2682810 RepID=A0A8A7K6H6_9FIRM|nr:MULTISPECIES: sugar kinase [Halanaerobiaceae]AZO93830.1 sugar kinase [Halocella sp. SP3-1]QTL96770.1 sugar kinase [Iocasia fonsfrigidae]
MPEVITLGETMVLMNPTEAGPLRYVDRFKKQIAGAETNVAIGINKLGHSTGWISRLGSDEFGQYVLSVIKGEGVDTSRVIMDVDTPTGVFFKERRILGLSQVYYYRRQSAASYMLPEDLDEEYIASARYLHLTGITPALSSSCLATVQQAIEIAHQNNVLVSFDPNIRFKLWDRRKAKEILLSLIREVDILLPGVKEADMLLGKMDEPEDYAQKFIEMGPEIVALKLGKTGSYIADKEKGRIVEGFSSTEVDAAGAGDAFAAGFLSGLLEGKDIFEAAMIANAAGAFAVTLPGDYEAFPTSQDLNAFLKGNSDIFR